MGRMPGFAAICGRAVRISAVVLLAASPARATALADAAKAQDAVTVRALLKQPGTNVNGAQADGTTALHWAAHWDDAETVDLLLRAGADANAATDYRVTPLALAAENRNAPIVERLLKAGADANAARVTGETVLMTAAWSGSVDVVRLLLAAGADVDAREQSENHTALMWAVAESHADVARLLVERGADVRARSADGFTPMLFAARVGCLACARVLIEAGANASDSVAKGPSALVVATVRGHVPMAIYLLTQGADANHAGAGYTALHWAAGTWETTLTGKGGMTLPATDDPRHGEWGSLRGLRTGKVELVKALLAHGADPNVRLVTQPPRNGLTKGTFEGRSLTGATPFLLAAMAGEVEVMRLLAAAGTDPTLPTSGDVATPEDEVLTSFHGGLRGGMTPLMAAAGLGRVISEVFVSAQATFEAARLALELGNDVNATNDYGETALHGAAHVRHDALVRFLVDKGAQVNAKTTRIFALNYGPLVGQTPLDYAERHIQVGGLPVHERSTTGDLLRTMGAQAGVPADAWSRADLRP